jgi:hypothetical protein
LSDFAKFSPVLPRLRRTLRTSQARSIAGSSPAMTAIEADRTLVRVNDYAPVRHRPGRGGGSGFINFKPSYVLLCGGESPLSGAAPSCAATMGIVMGGLFDKRRGTTMRVLGSRC